MSLTDNIIAYWKFDESSGNAADSTGNGWTLTNNGTVTYAAGKINNGADIESAGSDQYFNSADFSTTNAWSFSIWIKPETLGAVNYVPICIDDVSSNRVFSFLYSGNTNATLYGWTSDGTLKHTSGAAHGMSTGTWYHWAGTWDAAGNMTLYKNGAVFDTAVATTGNAKNATEAMNVGRMGNATNYYDGMVDEVGYWSRALSSTEITSLYNSGSGFTYPFTTTAISSINGLAKSSVSNFNGLAIASVKSIMGLE